ncbi:NAD-dependent epimerase/dehydratase family protein [Paenibacillus ginsengihumi]|uniref:NAD-dependent epimerase/dehydratase family protein n=1 Tax=Paenibacillus ginsengihumi TaxID=431596 RepID=UPI00037E37DF|nr:NAD-dependent epimerase/dehydratase family protein [Paenibacillus ginsengihumi]
MGMNVLVTGSTGFLGQKLAYRLLHEGYDVTATGRSEREGERLARAGIRFVRADLRDAESAAQLAAGQDIVFHCAALSAPWGRYADFYGSNVLGTRHLLNGCLRHGVSRFVHVSTPSIYFDGRDRCDIAETHPLPRKSANAYAATKLLAEREVDRASDLGLAAITIRPRAIFGPGDRTILPRLIEANRLGRVPLIGGGLARLDVTYVDNVVDALLLCKDAPERALGRKFNITNGEPVLLIELLQQLFAQLGQPLRPKRVPFAAAYCVAAGMELHARLLGRGKEPLLTRYTVGVLGKSQTLDISAAREVLGYTPRIGIEEGIAAFAQWWKKEGRERG